MTTPKEARAALRKLVHGLALVAASPDDAAEIGITEESVMLGADELAKARALEALANCRQLHRAASDTLEQVAEHLRRRIEEGS